MTVRIGCVTFDCTDPYALAGFWNRLTGYQPPAQGNKPGDAECELVAPDGGPCLLFVRVPEPKAGKNRVHLDVVPTDRTRDEEVQRLLGIGATVVDDRRQPNGAGWVVLADPEGNEFCVERGPADRAAAAAATGTPD